jgi:hypothetical protein
MNLDWSPLAGLPISDQAMFHQLKKAVERADENTEPSEAVRLELQALRLIMMANVYYANHSLAVLKDIRTIAFFFAGLLIAAILWRYVPSFLH